MTYPHADLDALLAAARAAIPAWRDAGPEVRAARLRRDPATGSTRAASSWRTRSCTPPARRSRWRSRPAARTRRTARSRRSPYAYAEMTRHAGDRDAGRSRRASGRRCGWTKTFTVVPRGVALVIGCNTFPTWNSYPGLFASLVTGNAVVVKPHPGAVLPLAITVSIAREVLAEAGFSPDLVTLAAEQPGEGLAQGAGRCGRRCGSSTSPGRPRSAPGWSSNARQAVGLHREGRRQHGRRRLDRRLPGHAREPRVLAVALQRADVHDAAEPARPRATASDRRRATSRSTSSRADLGARGRRSCSVRTRRRSSCSARSSTTACSTRLDECRGRSATVVHRVPGADAPRVPATPRCGRRRWCG